MNELPYRASRILRALGNPLRYRLIKRLLRYPATPGQLAEEFHRSIFVISRHLGVLRSLDLVCYTPKPPTYLYEAKYPSLQAILRVAEVCATRIREADAACADSASEWEPPLI